MIVVNVWGRHRESVCSAGKAELRVLLVGGTRLLLESKATSHAGLWGSLLKSLVKLAVAARTDGASVKESEKDGLMLQLEEEDVINSSREFDSSYSKLAFASIPSPDPTANVVSAEGYFCSALAAFCRSHAGMYLGAIQTSLDAKEAVALQQMLADNNVGLV